MPLRALASVNLAAIERNIGQLRSRLAERTELCAVVKANAYGHGAVPVGRAALDAGASWLAVASAAEAAELRAGGLEGPILVLGAVSREELPDALDAGAQLVAWTEEFVEHVAAAARAEVGLHVKLDTGLGRLGTRESSEALSVAQRILSTPGVRLTGAMTHFATADEDPEFVRTQLERFRPFVAQLREWVPGLVVHTANSAAILTEPSSHFDLVRPGIAIYGCDPMNQDPSGHGLEPALSLTSYVSAVKLAREGDSAGYGRRFVAVGDTWIATLPIGYADGIRRALSGKCDVLISGRRYPLVGAVSMDNTTVDLGPDPAVAVGEPATIIGADGSERQTAEDLARAIGTMNYEIVCGISARVPRVYHRDGERV